MYTLFFTIFFILYNSLFFSTAVYSETPPPCLLQFQTNFFSEKEVYQALSTNRIGQGSWALIMSHLNQNSKRIPSLMRSSIKNSALSPTETKKLLVQILYTIFRDALYSVNFYNESGIRNMFDFIYAHHSKELLACLKNMR